MTEKTVEKAEEWMDWAREARKREEEERQEASEKLGAYFQDTETPSRETFDPDSWGWPGQLCQMLEHKLKRRERRLERLVRETELHLEDLNPAKQRVTDADGRVILVVPMKRTLKLHSTLNAAEVAASEAELKEEIQRLSQTKELIWDLKDALTTEEAAKLELRAYLNEKLKWLERDVEKEMERQQAFYGEATEEDRKEFEERCQQKHKEAEKTLENGLEEQEKLIKKIKSFLSPEPSDD